MPMESCERPIKKLQAVLRIFEPAYGHRGMSSERTPLISVRIGDDQPGGSDWGDREAREGVGGED